MVKRILEYHGNCANVSRFYLPPSPTQTKAAGLKGWFRGKKGWFTDHQEVIMVTRILRDDPGKATMHNVRSYEGIQRI